MSPPVSIIYRSRTTWKGADYASSMAKIASLLLINTRNSVTGLLDIKFAFNIIHIIDKKQLDESQDLGLVTRRDS